MSTPIWDEGNVLVSLAARPCARCGDGKIKRCISLSYDYEVRDCSILDLCLDCFTDLQVDVCLTLLPHDEVPKL